MAPKQKQKQKQKTRRKKKGKKKSKGTEQDDAAPEAPSAVMDEFKHLSVSQRERGAKSMKEDGNKAYAKGNYEEALSSFSAALGLLAASSAEENKVEDRAVLHSNRAATYLKLKRPTKAMADALSCIQLRPAWAKGYTRLASAQWAKGNLKAAIAAYESGISSVEGDAKALEEGLAKAQQALKEEEAAAAPAEPVIGMT